jgi:DNA-binding transcriptional LysR family regulator
MVSADALASFVVFADHLNFTRAAAELHISQPALHVKVRKLAEALGRPLYRRDGRRLVLTADGEAIRRKLFERAVDEAPIRSLTPAEQAKLRDLLAKIADPVDLPI